MYLSRTEIVRSYRWNEVPFSTYEIPCGGASKSDPGSVIEDNTCFLRI